MQTARLVVGIQTGFDHIWWISKHRNQSQLYAFVTARYNEDAAGYGNWTEVPICSKNDHCQKQYQNPSVILPVPVKPANDCLCMADYFICGLSHKFMKAELKIGGKNYHGSDWKNRTSKSFPRSNSASEIHSSVVCACAMSPGPNTTLGIPLAASTAASQK